MTFGFLRQYWKTIIICGLILIAHLLVQVEGMKTTTATNTAWLITTIPIFIVILSYIFLRERISRWQLLGMVVAATGVLILVSRGNLGSLDFIKSYGDWMVLASCGTWTIYTVLGKRITGQNPLAIIMLVSSVVAIILIPPVIFRSGIDIYFALPGRVLYALLFLGVFCQGIAYWIWLEGLKRKSAGQVGTFLYLEPLSTMAAAPFILGESITPSLIGGGILVVIGVWLVQLKKTAP
ncbi:MAG: DMT family transporter [FCB group bacterium]|nr:DMT family transporter [FCB group bacterium]